MSTSWLQLSVSAPKNAQLVSKCSYRVCSFTRSLFLFAAMLSRSMFHFFIRKHLSLLTPISLSSHRVHSTQAFVCLYGGRQNVGLKTGGWGFLRIIKKAAYQKLTSFFRSLSGTACSTNPVENGTGGGVRPARAGTGGKHFW